MKKIELLNILNNIAESYNGFDYNGNKNIGEFFADIDKYTDTDNILLSNCNCNEREYEKRWNILVNESHEIYMTFIRYDINPYREYLIYFS